MKIKSNPLVTIVSPSYNQARYLERTILSVLNQDYPNLEYIVIDGGSTDGSIDIIKKYEHKISYWVSEPDRGQSHAINKGFKKATGEIFNWLNSDDILMPSATTIAVHCLTNNPEYGMVYGDRLVIDQNDQVLSCIEMPSFNRFFYKFRPWLPQETVFFRRELWHKVNGVDESLNYSMDKDLWLKFVKISKIHHIPFFLGAWRQHNLAKSYINFVLGNVSNEGHKESSQVQTKHLKRIYRLKTLKNIMNKIDKIRFIKEKYSTKRKSEISDIRNIVEGTRFIAEDSKKAGVRKRAGTIEDI